MSTDNTSGGADGSSPAENTAAYVQLFQKAHQKIVTLERIDEQVTQLLAKRQELQEELRTIQGHLNAEFDHRLRVAAESPLSGKSLVVTVSENVKRAGNGRFAATSPIDTTLTDADER